MVLVALLVVGAEGRVALGQRADGIGSGEFCHKQLLQ